MCGICGFTGIKNGALLKGMTASLVHRGPDEDGFFSDEERVSLGMRRLKIIDLATGSQPVFNEDRTVAVVFNGEIYNFKELRAELQAQGHRFATNSDTEVLVHLYEQYGAAFPARLRGMFAFALWDARERRLLLGRDQFGVKPLFYAQAGDKLFFASELKALLLSPEIPADLDPAAIDAYFTFLYIPSPLTAYRHIKKLEPAQTLTFSGGKAEIKTYWTLPEFSRGAARSEGEYLEGIDGLLAKSVTEQLVSDVPLGLLLSGGMDSSAALYYMSRALKEPVKTFTIGYGPKDASFNEAAGARLLAGHFKTEHHEAFLEPDVRSIMEKLAAQFDEPFADASAIPTYLVTGEARKKVTVALTGIGGDELFGGYPRHLGARLLPGYMKLPATARKWLWAAARYMPESASSFNTPGRIKRFMKGGLGDFRSGYESWTSYFSKEERALLYAGGLLAPSGPHRYELPRRPANPDDIYAYELRNYLSDDLLCLADRASMANSLELRVPFLDVRLAEFMAGAPLSLKTGGFRLKSLLKKVMAGRLPAETLAGAKQGFQVPMARWFREEIKGFIGELLSPAALKKNGCLDPDYIGALLREHERGGRNLGDQVYAAAMFELWLSGRGRRPALNASTGALELRVPLTILVCTDIIQQDDEGGSGRVAWETAKQLASVGHKVIVLTKGAPGRRYFEKSEGVEIYRYRTNPLNLFKAVREIKARHGRIDALDLHHPYTGLLARLAAPEVPCAYSFHSPWGEEFATRGAGLGYSRPRIWLGAWLRKRIEKAAISGCGVVFNASRFMAEKLKASHALESRIEPLGVDVRKFTPAADRAAVRKRLGIAADRPLVFTVRNLVDRMGLENLIEAAGTVVKKNSKALFVIGGRGYLREKLEALISAAGLEENVRLEGFIPDSELQYYYQCADLFVLPTAALEGFGLVTLEALACGTPVLATPVAANLEVLGGFKKEMLLKGASGAEIAEGVLNFFEKDKRGLAELRAECREFVEANYSWEKYAGMMETVLYEISKGAR